VPPLLEPSEKTNRMQNQAAASLGSLVALEVLQLVMHDQPMQRTA